MLKPLPGYSLVKLPQNDDSGLTLSREKYEQISKGTFICGNSDVDMEPLHGTTVYFQPYQSGEPIVIDDNRYVFIDNTKIMGYKEG